VIELCEIVIELCEIVIELCEIVWALDVMARVPRTPHAPIPKGALYRDDQRLLEHQGLAQNITNVVFLLYHVSASLAHYYALHSYQRIL